MSFIYPRVVAIKRPAAQAGIGVQAYGGQSVASETPVATDLPASIQQRREGRENDADLPSDTQQATYYVFIPKRALANGTVSSRDIVIDDTGNRYQVIAPYWDSLGYRLSVLALET